MLLGQYRRATAKPVSLKKAEAVNAYPKRNLRARTSKANGRVSFNVRSHKYNVCVPRYTAKSEIQKKIPRPSQPANLKTDSMECILKDGMAMLARFVRRRFWSGLDNKVSSSNPPPFGAILLRVVPVAAAGENQLACHKRVPPASAPISWHARCASSRQDSHQSSDA